MEWNLTDLDKRICDVEPNAANTQTYREFILESMEEFGLPMIDFTNEEEVVNTLEFCDDLWSK